MEERLPFRALFLSGGKEGHRLCEGEGLHLLSLNARRVQAVGGIGCEEFPGDSAFESSVFVVEPLESSIIEEEGFRAALDCDVLFSCVDRPWPRSVLNFIAFAHLIPVVDGGVLVATKRGGTTLRHADVRAHVAAPGRRCLECLGQYDPGSVSTERDGYLDDPSYITGLPEDHPSRANQNVFAFGMAAASLEMLQFLSMVIAPSGLSNPGAQMYHFVTGGLDVEREACHAGCIYPKLTARGDHAGVVVIGRHRHAEQVRERRQCFRRSLQYRLLCWQDWLRHIV